MNKEQILEAIKILSYSQGYYGRLYARLTDGSETSKRALELFEEQNFSDVVDLMIFLEKLKKVVKTFGNIK
jgi:hypothetical protein